MSIYSCSIPSCTIPAISICECTNPIFYGCGIHGHFDKSQASHPCKKIYSEVTTSTAFNLDHICNEYEVKISDSLQIASSVCSKLISNIKANFKKLISEYADLQRKILEVRKLGKRGKSVSILDNATEAEKIISKFMINPEDNISDWGKYKILITEEEVKNIILKNTSIFVDDSTIITIPKARTNRLMKIDILSYHINETEVQIDEDFAYASGWCKINTNQLFVYGGALSCVSSRPLVFSMSGKTLILDTSIDCLIYSGDGPLKSDMGNGILFNNEIYFFGGFDMNTQALDSVNKFDLNAKLWKNAANLPTGMGYCSSAIINSLIYISGSPAIDVYQYSPEGDFYNSIFEFESAYKSIFIFNKKIFILFDGCLMCIDESNGVSTQNVDIPNMFMLGHSTLYKSSIYFVLGKYDYMSGLITSNSLCKIDGYTNELQIVANDLI
ncbi:hypothetical protein SteCoe_27256 [Stentor coeruleus]|uniref:Uncharacterized protein n=1 Tax=Stentor coeruleus TaxID=5963 RepID=A0A1R2BB16_9CILI|nr:hypothetical protein SteCoe_27256 [Stentor coeruleus]